MHDRLNREIEQVNRIRRIYMDLSPGKDTPKRGWYVLTISEKGVGTVYQVMRSREVNRRDPEACRRVNLWVKVIARKPDDKFLATLDGKTKIFLQWYSRKKKKRTFEQYMRRHD